MIPSDIPELLSKCDEMYDKSDLLSIYEEIQTSLNAFSLFYVFFSTLDLWCPRSRPHKNQWMDRNNKLRNGGIFWLKLYLLNSSLNYCFISYQTLTSKQSGLTSQTEVNLKKIQQYFADQYSFIILCRQINNNQECDLTTVKNPEMGSRPGSPFGLQDKAHLNLLDV